MKTEIIELTAKDILEFLDIENTGEFRLCGIRYLTSGCREEVEAQKQWVCNLNAEPLKIFKVKPNYPDPKKMDCLLSKSLAGVTITVNIGSSNINIYKYKDVKDTKDTIFSNLSPERPVLQIYQQ